MKKKNYSSLKDSTWAPYKQTKQFRELFRFHKDIRSQSSKIRLKINSLTPRSVRIKKPQDTHVTLY